MEYGIANHASACCHQQLSHRPILHLLVSPLLLSGAAAMVVNLCRAMRVDKALL